MDNKQRSLKMKKRKYAAHSKKSIEMAYGRSPDIAFKDTRFFKYLKQFKGRYLVGCGVLLVVNLLQLITPRLTGDIIDMLSKDSINNSQLMVYAGIIVLTSFLIFIFNYFTRILMQGSSNLIDMMVRNDMFKQLTKLSLNYFNKKPVGDIMALSINDVSAVEKALGRGVMLIIESILLIFSSILIMWQSVDLRLTLAVFIPLPLLMYIMTKFGRIINQRFRKVQESFANLTTKAQENISGIRVIKAFVQEEKEISNFNKLNQDNFDINLNLAKVQGVFGPLIRLISSLSYCISLIYGGNLVLLGSISLGDFVAFNGYIGILVRPVTFIGMIINFIQRGKASASRVEELFNEKPDVYDSEAITNNVSMKSDSKLKGNIEFNNLTFSYNEDSKPTLKDINLKIKSGKTIAVIGKIGSGKSTLGNLLLRLYNPNSRGQLFIDGKDIMDIPLEVLRNSIGYVPQDNYLFSATVQDNVNFSPYKRSMDEIEEAVKISHVYDNIMEFPDKFEAMIGERGVNLSGGQKQRISIARALVNDPSILILDDCLSAVDTNTEKRILDGLKTFMKNKTCIFIAHRISTIKDADEIIVLDNGRIVEHGTHDELVERKGFYHRIYKKQMLEEQIQSA